MSDNLKAWKARETSEIDLGDGRKLVVRMIDPIMMFAGSNGDTPNPLLGIIFRDAKGAKAGVDFQKELENKPELLRPMAEMMRAFTLKAVVDPPLTENGHPPEQSISVDSIPFEAKMKVFEFVMGGSEALSNAQNFLKAEGSSVVSASNSKTVPEPSVENTGD